MAMLTVQRPNEMRIKGANSDLKSNNLNLTSPQKPVSKNQKDRINKHQTLQKDQSSSSSVSLNAIGVPDHNERTQNSNNAVEGWMDRIATGRVKSAKADVARSKKRKRSAFNRPSLPKNLDSVNALATDLTFAHPHRTRRGEFGEFSLVLPKKPDSESENEPYILKPSTRRPRTVRINSRNPNSRVASIRQTRNRSISARRTPRRSILPDDHREFPTGNISLNVNEPSSPRKSVVLDGFEELPSQRMLLYQRPRDLQKRPLKIERNVPTNGVANQAIQNTRLRTKIANGEEIERSPFQEGDKLPRISSDAVNFVNIQNSFPNANGSKTFSDAKRARKPQPLGRPENQSNAPVRRLYDRNNSIGPVNGDRLFDRKPSGAHLNNRKSMMGLTPMSRKSYKENALPGRYQANLAQRNGRKLRVDNGDIGDDEISVARLSVSVADSPSPIMPRSNRHRSQLVPQNTSRNNTLSRDRPIIKNYRSVYDYGIFSQPQSYLNLLNGYDSPSTWSQLERFKNRSRERSHLPNDNHASARTANYSRNPQPKARYRRPIDQSLVDDSISVKTVPAQNLSRHPPKSEIAESKSMNFSKALTTTNGYKGYNGTLPHVPLRKKNLSAPIIDFSLVQFKNLLATEVNPGDPRPLLKEFGTIGEGSTSVVKLARYLPDNTLVAIKKMNIANQQRPELLINEAVLMRTFNHPNIVKMFSSYIINNELWVIMEFMDCGALTSVLTRTRLNEKQVATICIPILSALAFLHSNSIIHRDIKSDSILLSSDGRVKLSDFGFCATITPQCPRRRSLVGTPYWMAPEVIARSSYSTAADIWSFGVLVIEMTDGEPSLFNETPSVAMRLIKERFVPHLKHPGNHSNELIDFLNATLPRDDARRATAAQLLQHPFLLFAGPSTCIRPLFKPILLPR